MPSRKYKMTIDLTESDPEGECLDSGPEGMHHPQLLTWQQTIGLARISDQTMVRRETAAKPVENSIARRVQGNLPGKHSAPKLSRLEWRAGTDPARRCD